MFPAEVSHVLSLLRATCTTRRISLDLITFKCLATRSSLGNIPNRLLLYLPQFKLLSHLFVICWYVCTVELFWVSLCARRRSVMTCFIWHLVKNGISSRSPNILFCWLNIQEITIREPDHPQNIIWVLCASSGHLLFPSGYIFSDGCHVNKQLQKWHSATM